MFRYVYQLKIDSVGLSVVRGVLVLWVGPCALREETAVTVACSYPCSYRRCEWLSCGHLLRGTAAYPSLFMPLGL